MFHDFQQFLTKFLSHASIGVDVEATNIIAVQALRTRWFFLITGERQRMALKSNFKKLWKNLIPTVL